MKHLRPLLAGIILAGILACASQPTPAPSPTATPAPTPNLPATIDAAVAATAAANPTPTPTPTPAPTPTPGRLDAIPCEPPSCVTAVEPDDSVVTWLEGPSVTADGRFAFVARLDAGDALAIPDPENTYPNVVFSEKSGDGTGLLYGSVVPPLSGGYRWTARPGLWVAEVYEYRRGDNTLRVRAQVDPAAAAHRGLRVCLWSGGGAASRILGCAAID